MFQLVSSVIFLALVFFVKYNQHADKLDIYELWFVLFSFWPKNSQTNKHHYDQLTELRRFEIQGDLVLQCDYLFEALTKLCVIANKQNYIKVVQGRYITVC